MTNQSDIKKLAEQMAGSMKSFDDIKDFQKQLMQSFIDTALEAEMEDHLGYPKHEKADKPNKRNGHTKKTVRSDTGELEISTPRDRDSSFEPVIISKHQTRISGLDDKIIFFYAKGQTTTEIVETIKELYDVDISSSLVSRVTDNILEDITAWQNRPLSSVYPIVYLDCIVVKVRQDKQIINKAIYLALGVALNGKKELLGMWLSENEGAKFWLGVLTELQNRGVQDILIACVDGLKGFPDAINTVYPNAQSDELKKNTASNAVVTSVLKLPPTQTITSLSIQTCSIKNLIPIVLTSRGLVTSLTYGQMKVGYTWQVLKTSILKS